MFLLILMMMWHPQLNLWFIVLLVKLEAILFHHSFRYAKYFTPDTLLISGLFSSTLSIMFIMPVWNTSVHNFYIEGIVLSVKFDG
jgi:hypothetical protein